MVSEKTHHLLGLVRTAEQELCFVNNKDCSGLGHLGEDLRGVGGGGVEIRTADSTLRERLERWFNLLFPNPTMIKREEQ